MPSARCSRAHRIGNRFDSDAMGAPFSLRLIAGLASLAAVNLQCGSPAKPTPNPPPTNTPPVIRSLTASTARTELLGIVDLSATAEDQESAADRLRFEWSAAGGTFSGTGAAVQWQAPASATTPANYPLTLTIVEPYQALNAAGQIVTLEHRVSSQVAVRVHDSPKELGDIGLRFLSLFANSAVSPQQCVVDFSDNCRGKASEIADIEQNRRLFRILSHTPATPRVSYTPGSNVAQVTIRVTIVDQIVTCVGWPPAWGPCVPNRVNDPVTFDARLPSVYENGRWWICESHADSVGASVPLRYVRRIQLQQ
jgi:hypothetical protein